MVVEGAGDRGMGVSRLADLPIALVRVFDVDVGPVP